jgi:nitric oxide reductase NorQ protein
LDYFDYETEVAVTQARSGLDRTCVETIVRIVRGLRESGKCEFAPTVRGCIMIGKTLKVQGLTVVQASTVFGQMCQDILASETSRVGSKTNQNRVREIVSELVARELAGGLRSNDESGEREGNGIVNVDMRKHERSAEVMAS